MEAIDYDLMRYEQRGEEYEKDLESNFKLNFENFYIDYRDKFGVEDLQMILSLLINNKLSIEDLVEMLYSLEEVNTNYVRDLPSPYLAEEPYLDMQILLKDDSFVKQLRGIKKWLI